MIEKPTDEQLDQWSKTGVPAISVPLLLAHAVALRAERAKPTPSDEERAKLAYGETRMRFQTGANDPLGPMLAAFASIRAEGSAERAKLEAALKKLVAMCVLYTDGKIGWNDMAFVRVRTSAGCCLLAKPAESGATEEDAEMEHYRRRCMP